MKRVLGLSVAIFLSVSACGSDDAGSGADESSKRLAHDTVPSAWKRTPLDEQASAITAIRGRGARSVSTTTHADGTQSVSERRTDVCLMHFFPVPWRIRCGRNWDGFTRLE